MRLTIDENIAYHWKHNAVKYWNIHSHKESNPEPKVLLWLFKNAKKVRTTYNLEWREYYQFQIISHFVFSKFFMPLDVHYI
jgi:hypothetical protein